MAQQGAVVFVTGGAGYVGSHCVLELLNAGYQVVAADNFVNAFKDENSKPEALARVERITGKSVIFYEVDLLDSKGLDNIFENHKIDCVIHFAALKAVGESVMLPLSYYKNNVGGTIALLEAMKKAGVKRLIFSSSATVYGTPQYVPIDEAHPTGQTCTNPYGRSKYFAEEIMKDLCHTNEGWGATILRYFNPVGAHKSGLIGEDPQGIPNNLMPFIAQVAVGRRDELMVYGNDYETPDGTGVRDYIHVVDLATGHVAAVQQILRRDVTPSCKIYNLGTGKGCSVLDMVQAFEKASNKKIPYRIASRRAGDVSCVYADCTLAEQELGWKSKCDILEMCEDSWRWQVGNPSGFNAPK